MKANNKIYSKENTSQSLMNTGVNFQTICPHCGNSYLNRLITATNEWYCSRKQCRRPFKEVIPFKPAA